MSTPVAPNVSLHSARDLRAELDDLQRDLLPKLVPGVLALSWLWCAYVTWHQGRFETHFPPAFLTALAAWAAYGLRRRNFVLASWLLILSLMVASGWAATLYPSLLVLGLGVLIVFVTYSLLGAIQAFLVATLLSLMQASIWLLAPASRAAGCGIPGLMVLYFLAGGTAWLMGRPLKTAVTWALTGWAEAHASLLETRERRAELYRVVRALDEATCRIERMNNELLIARREAEQARALKARFAAAVSHELRGPLSLILGFSRFMALSPERYGEPLPKAYRADVDAVYRSSQHLLSLVDDVLDLSQIEAQRMPLYKTRIDLEADVVKNAISIAQPLAQRKGLYVRQDSASDLPMILADPVRLSQALLNLLNNAARFTEHGGITVSTRQADSCILVSVQDTGPGIAPEEMPNLFKEFHRIHVTETREQGGSGLGLSICRHLVELHGGRISVESTPGIGTIFTIELPLSMAREAETSMVLAGESQAQTVSPVCLVVHQEPDVARLLARHMEGCRVVGVPDEQEAFTLTEALHPRAIIASLGAGERIAQQIQGTPYDVPVVSCSLNQTTGQVSSHKATRYLMKPIAQETVDAVMRHIERNGETTILIVDDEPDAVRLLEGMLLSIPRPYHILRAYDGLQALELMRTTVPDVVFLDWAMPGMDGRGIIAKMHADERLVAVPVVIVSARECTDDSITLESPLVVRFRRPLGIVRGTQCLSGLLRALSPRYLPDAEFPA